MKLNSVIYFDFKKHVLASVFSLNVMVAKLLINNGTIIGNVVNENLLTFINMKFIFILLQQSIVNT